MRRVFIVLVLTLTLLVGFALGMQSSTSTDGVKVWVDTAYGFYHCPDSKWYGKTKQGVYMSQKQARDRSYRPAYGVACKSTATPSKAAKPSTSTKKPA
jgi:hypothetical protein